jgi:hypothetical protein
MVSPFSHHLTYYSSVIAEIPALAMTNRHNLDIKTNSA